MDAKSVLVAILALAAWSFARIGAADPTLIKSVAVNKPFFNPTVGQTMRVDLELSASGSISILILDRDGYPVRRLVSSQPIQAGKVGYDWDGRDEAGAVVPDEAYSLKIDFSGEKRSESYFPANTPGKSLSVTTNYYDRQGAVLSYRLPAPARVHIQAGTASLNAKTGTRDGPVLKTLVNRAPRASGPVIENWNGFDESNAFYVPDLPDFVVAIAATSLPENAIITFGNREVGFLETAASRQGKSLLTVGATTHEHHAGLGALDDVAPRLKATILDATWSSADRLWVAKQDDLHVSISLDGPSAGAFSKQPAFLAIFLDDKKIKQVDSPRPGMTVEVKLPKSLPGTHVLAMNWVSAFGPVAVDALQINRGGGSPPPVATASAGR